MNKKNIVKDENGYTNFCRTKCKHWNSYLNRCEFGSLLVFLLDKEGNCNLDQSYWTRKEIEDYKKEKGIK